MILHFEIFECFPKTFNLISEFLTNSFKLDLTNLKRISIPKEIPTPKITKKKSNKLIMLYTKLENSLFHNISKNFNQKWSAC